MINPQEQFANLQTAFAPQQQMALQSAEAIKRQVALANSQNSGARGLASLYSRQPDAPQLKFGVDVPDHSIAEGVTQGLGNAVNNFIQMKHYGNQQRQVQDLANYYQDQQKQARDLATQQAAQQQQLENNQFNAIQQRYPDLAGAYQNSNAEGRNKLWTDLATRDVGLTYTPKEGTAEGQKQVNEANVINQAVKNAGPVELGGVPQPGQIDNIRQIRGTAPTTSLDVNKQILDNKSADLGLQSAQVGLRKDINDLGAQPQRIKQELESNSVKIAQDRVNLKHADALKQIEVLTGQGKLEEAQKAKQNLDDGQQRYQTALGLYTNMNNGQIKLFNTQMKSLGLPYELPEKENLKAATKNGNVKEFYNEETGTVYKPKKAK
jgi:hypothetical protein